MGKLGTASISDQKGEPCSVGALGIVSNSPYGIVGPKGMDARVVRILHDGFKKALEDPEHLKMLDQLDQELWCQSSEDYAKYAREPRTAA